MNYAKIITADIANGPGFRVSLFVSGCARNCPGCFNPETHDPDFGKPFDSSAKEKIFTELSKDWIDGLSLLGGEPMSLLSDNRKVITEFVKEVKEKFPNKTIWMWTGYTIEELKNEEILNYIDGIVDGGFIEDLHSTELKWRGSSNQRIMIKGKDSKYHLYND